MASQNIWELFFDLELSDKQLLSELSRIEKGLQKKWSKSGQIFGKSFWWGMKKAFWWLWDIFTPQTLWLAWVVLWVRKALDVFKEYEKVMSEVKAVSWATADEFDNLSDKSKELGATTEFSASQAAWGMVFLSRAWLSAREQLVAIWPALDLATAANIDLAKSADISTNILSQFGWEIEDLPHTIDVLSATTASSNTNMLQLAEAFKYAWPTAKALGISIEETAATVGILGNNGLQWSLATRALWTSLTRLAKPTTAMQGVMKELNLELFDQEGNFVGISETVGQLEKWFEWYTNQQKQASLSTLFWAEAIQEMNILLAAGGDEISNYTKELEDSDWATAKMSATMRDNLQGSVNNLKSVTEGLWIAMGERLWWAFRVVVDIATSVVRSLTSMVEWMERLKNRIALLVEENENWAKASNFVKEALTATVWPMVEMAKSMTWVENKLGIGVDYAKQYWKQIRDLWNDINVAKLSLIELNEAYASWAVNTAEYEKQEAELNKTIEDATKKQEELNAVNEQQMQINKERSDILREINAITKDWNMHIDKKNAKSSVLRGKLAELEKEEIKLKRTTDLMAESMGTSSHALDALSTAKSRDEFEKLRKTQLSLIYSDFQLLKAEEAKMKAFAASGQISSAEYNKFLSTAIESTKKLKNAYEQAKLVQYSWWETPAAPKPPWGGGGGWSSIEDKAKKYAEEQIAIIEEKARVEKTAILNTVKSKEIATKKIQKLDADTEIKKLELQGKTAEANLRRAEQEQDIREEISWMYEDQEKDIQDWIDDTVDKLGDYRKEIKKVEDAYAELWEKAKTEIFEINKAMQDWAKDLANDLSWRYVEIWNELETLKKKSWKTKEDRERIKALTEEQALIKKNVDATKITEAQRVSELSNTEKILENYEKEKAALEEAKKLREQVSVASQAWGIGEQFEVRESDEGVQEVFAKDEEGVFQKITDDKNAQYVIDTLNKGTELELQKEALVDQVALELWLQQDLLQQKKLLETDWQTFLQGEKDKEVALADQLYDKRLQVYQMRQKAAWGWEVTSRASGWPLAKGQTSFVSEKWTELFKSWNDYSILPPGLFTPQTNWSVVNAQKTKNMISKSISLWGLTIQWQNITWMSESEMKWFMDKYLQDQLSWIDRFRE